MALANRKVLGRLGLGLLIGLLAWLLMLTGVTADLELASLDSRFLLRSFGSSLIQPGASEDLHTPRVVVVGIDTASLESLGSWPWPRSYHARVVEQLKEAGARVIGFDLIFAEPSQDPAEDVALAKALEGSIPVVLPVVVEATAERKPFFPAIQRSKESGVTVHQLAYPIEPLRKMALLGHIGVFPDRDGIVRRIPEEFNGLTPFAIQVARAGGKPIRNLPGSFTVNLRLSSLTGGLSSLFTVLPYKDVFTGDFDPDLIKDNVVIIGSMAPGLKADFFPVSLRLLGYAPGVIFQAAAVDTILREAYIKQFPSSAAGALVLALLSAAVATILFTGHRPGRLILIYLGVVAGVLAGSMVAFARDTWILLVGPMLLPISFAFVGAIISGQLLAERTRDVIRQTFGRYVPRSVLYELMKNPEQASLGGGEKYVAVFFADFRGFTGFAEEAEPSEVVRDLNEVFSQLVPMVEARGGIVDKFLGDALMAVFGAPVSLDHPEESAVKAAITLLESQVHLGKRNLSLGIGLAAGVVVAGNIGSKERLSYTVVGNTVNTAARLEKLARPGELLITADVWEGISRELQEQFKSYGPVDVRGLTKAVHIYAYQQGEIPCVLTEVN